LLGASAAQPEPAKSGLALAAAGALVKPYHEAFDDDNLCLSNNKSTAGDMATFATVFDPAQIAARFDAAAQGAFVGSISTALGSSLTVEEQAAAIANKADGLTDMQAVEAATMAKIEGEIAKVVGGELGKVGGAPAPTITLPAACTKPALTHTKVTIGGKEYGCGYDDQC